MSSFLQNKHVTLTLLVFIVAILTAKNFIIIHEETLVLLCFVLFLIFIYTMLKDMLTSTFNERAQLIENEFNAAYELKEQTLLLLAAHHAKQISLLEEITSILTFTKTELDRVIQTRQVALKSRLINEFRNKLNLAQKKEEAFFQFVQQSANGIIMENVLNSLSGSEGAKYKDLCFEEGIRVVELTSNVD